MQEYHDFFKSWMNYTNNEYYFSNALLLIFNICLLYNNEAAQTLINEFDKMINLIIPYCKNHFLFSFLFNCLKQDDLKEYGVLLINKLLKVKINKEENNFGSGFPYFF